jgi:hypothetical protein
MAACPPTWLAKSSRMRVCIWQGPHHGAQKSTRTIPDEVAAPKERASSVKMFPEGDDLFMLSTTVGSNAPFMPKKT